MAMKLNAVFGTMETRPGRTVVSAGTPNVQPSSAVEPTSSGPRANSLRSHEL